MSALLSIHLSSLSLVTQTKRKWKKHHTHTQTQKNKTKTERKISFAFKRTEGWLELFHKKWKGGFWESACGACACEWVCVRARAVFLWTLSRKERRKERVKLWSGEEHRRKKDFAEENLYEDLFVPFGQASFFPSFFPSFFSFFFPSLFPFSLFPPIGCQCPMPKRQTKDKRHKIKRRKENSTAKIRKIISYVTRIGDWIHFENSQRDDTTIRKDVRITQWPRKTPH